MSDTIQGMQQDPTDTNTFHIAVQLHERVPPDWYESSMRTNAFQRFWHTRRFDEVRQFIEPTGGKILDIGSADGTFTHVIAEASHAEEIIGIDVLSESIAWANNRWRGTCATFRLGDAHSLEFPHNTFDAVFALEVLEHVKDPVAVLREIERVLKPGGYGIFLVPSDSLLFRCIWWVWTKLRGRVWAHTHIQTFRAQRLTHLTRAANLLIETDRKFLLGMLHSIKARKSPT
jgi:2-polyprenyl-3-methyl-5-hydroxy-6-metoxy-1,4-benzoquinol methylase